MTHMEPKIQERPRKGILLMCAAITSFSVLDATAKYLATVSQIPVEEVIWLRFVWHVLLTIAIFGPMTVPRLIKSVKPGHQLLRSLFMLGATAFNFAALQYLQLDQTITIFFLSPLIVAALAGPLLGEWVGWRRLVAICAGFAGIILVTRPGFGGIHWAVFLSLAAALSYALYNISTRYLAAYDSSDVTQFYTPIVGLIAFAPFAIASWTWPQDWMTWLLLFSLGLTGGAGHWLLILAHKYAPAPTLAPFVYVGIISISLLGYLIFGDIPSLWTLSGGTIVIMSGLYLWSREQDAKP